MTGRSHKDAPIFRDAYMLCQWLLERLDGNAGILPRQLCENALALLDAVVLALKGHDRAHRLEHADRRLVAVRMRLQLAAELNLLSES